MKKILYSAAAVIALQFLLYACLKDDLKLGTPPTAADAAFTYTPSEATPNILNFSNTSTAFLKKWDFGNGTTGVGSTPVGTFPVKGSYEVTLTIFSSGGSVSSTQTIQIAETDPTLLDIPIYNQLTGGKDALDGKTWVIDSASGGHFGVGAIAAMDPNYYKAAANEKAGAGLYNDRYTFKLAEFRYIQDTKGEVFINGKQAANFPGSYPNSGDDTAPFVGADGLTWSVTTDADNNQFLNISTGGFVGYFTGVNTYQILTISDDVMNLRYLDAGAGNDGLAWYLRLIRAGSGTPPPPPVTTTLPIDMQGAKPPVTTFGGTTFDVVDNPDATGVNTSTKVGKFIKGTEGNWAGLSFTLPDKIDLTTNSIFKWKVYSPVTGIAKFKLESSADPNTSTELDANITVTNQWQELSYDFSAASSNTYDKISLFLDFANNNGGTFYFDDVRQTAENSVLTEAALTGGSAKSWVLKPSAGAFGVGPAKGSDAYYPNGVDLHTARPCLFNDEYIFKTGNVYEYDTKGDIFGEGYMGITPDGCTSDTNLPVDAASWGSGLHTFTFTPATGSTPAYITVAGTGAFIALPKAHNGGEYASAPPTTDASVQYEVMSYVKNGASETIYLTLDIGGGTFWNFILVNK